MIAISDNEECPLDPSSVALPCAEPFGDFNWYDCDCDLEPSEIHITTIPASEIHITIPVEAIQSCNTLADMFRWLAHMLGSGE